MFEYNWMFGSLVADLVALSISAIVLGVFIGYTIYKNDWNYKFSKVVIHKVDKLIVAYARRVSTNLSIDYKMHRDIYIFPSSDVMLRDGYAGLYPKVLTIENVDERLDVKIHQDQLDMMKNIFKNINNITL